MNRFATSTLFWSVMLAFAVILGAVMIVLIATDQAEGHAWLTVLAMVALAIASALNIRRYRRSRD